MEMLTLPLSKPIKHLDEEITELKFRCPTADDAIKLGYPSVYASDGNPIFNAKIVYNYLVELTALPLSTVKKLELSDVEKFKYFLGTFFGSSKEDALGLLTRFSTWSMT